MLRATPFFPACTRTCSPPRYLFPFLSCPTSISSSHQRSYHQLQLNHPNTNSRKGHLFVSSTSSAGYEVGGGYPEEENETTRNRNSGTGTDTSSEREALLKGGEQVISVLEEMIILVSFPPSLLLSLSLHFKMKILLLLLF